MEKSTNLHKKNIIVCLDIGDGECSAFSLRKNSAGFFKIKEELFLAQDGEERKSRIPSVMCYDKADNVVIGELKIREEYICVSNFKKSPPYEDCDRGWDEPCLQTNRDKSFRECMILLVGQLWRNIIRYNSREKETFEGRNLADIQREQDVAIFVGCPASDDWLANAQKEKYKELIRAATGIDSIYVIPESTASAFGAVMRNKSIKYKDGVAVFDFGSSTADFTYIYGDKREKLSWTLGANSIDKAIYRLIYEEAGFDLGDDDFPYKDTKVCREFEMRTNIKEEYFRPYDEEMRTKDFTFHSDELDRDFIIDECFMKRALNTRVRTIVKENGKGRMNGDGKGWRELCKDFFYRCQGLLNDSCPVGRIILAGGASNMYFVEDICREVFKKEPEHEILPYHCVSEGLCQVAKNLLRHLLLFLQFKNICLLHFMRLTRLTPI